jgi:hypothetical protein
MEALHYSKLKLVIENQWAQPKGNDIAYLILGRPGGGKSALARDIIASLGGNDENTVEFNGSTRDPVDVLGTPNNNGDYTRWVPPEEFYKLRDIPGDDGPRFLNLEEMTDMSVPMQNAICRVIYDRAAGSLRLHRNLHIIASGNRTEDKSGASRLTTKLGNRLRIHTYQENLQDWVDWAQAVNIDPVLVQFLRFKPQLLSDFDPNRPYGINPTPRAWERVARINTGLPNDLYFHEAAGDVGEGAAAEYAAFRKVYESLVSLEDVVMNPKGVKVPTDLSALYATVGSCAYGTTTGNIERLAEFVERLPSDFSTMFWMDARKKEPKIKATKAFIKWATANSNVILN